MTTTGLVFNDFNSTTKLLNFTFSLGSPENQNATMTIKTTKKISAFKGDFDKDLYF